MVVNQYNIEQLIVLRKLKLLIAKNGILLEILLLILKVR